MVKTRQTEIEKRHYAVMGQQYIKGRRIKLTPNERALLGLIVHRSEHEGGNIRLANKTICGVFGWDPTQLNRACKGLISKGLINKDTSEAVHGQQGSEYTLLLSTNEAERPVQAIEQQLPFQSVEPQNTAEQQNDNELISLLKGESKRQKEQIERLGKSLWAMRERVEAIEQYLEALGKQLGHLANVFNPRKEL